MICLKIQQRAWIETMTMMKFYKTAILLLSLISFVKSEIWNPNINANLLANKIRAKVDGSLKPREMQAYLDTLHVKENNINEDSLKKIELVGDKFQKYIEAIRRLRQRIVEAYENPTSSDAARPCCDFSRTLKVAPGYGLPVDLSALCQHESEFTRNGSFHIPHVRFMEQALENRREIPTLSWQAFSSEEGATIVYPAVAFSKKCLFTTRIRHWYIQAMNSIPQEVVIAIDKSGSMQKIYKGKTLIEFAVEAAKLILSTLSPRDKFAVIAFGITIETLRDKYGDDTCFSYTLAQATQVNVEKAKQFLDSIVPEGGTFYHKGLLKAFRFFEKDSETISDRRAQRAIMFFSDGSTEDSKSNVLATAQKANSALNDSVVIMTYGLGDGETSILQELPNSNQNPTKKGEYKTITDPTHFLEEISSYYKRFALSKGNVTDPLWMVPFVHIFTQTQISTASLPVFANNKFVGVVSIDVIMEELFADVITFTPNENSYAFVVDGAGLIFNHPLLPYKDNSEAIYVLATALEQDEEFRPIFASMKRGESGKETFFATRFASQGGYRNRPMRRKKILSTYIWRKVPNANFSICFVIATNETDVHISSNASLPSGSFLYHRVDVIPPKSPCHHLNTHSSFDESAVSLSARCFKNPGFFLYRVFSKDDLISMANFMEGKENDTIGIKDSAKTDVVLTYYAFQLWANASSPESLKHLLWRYIGTQHGVFRIFPAAQLPKDFDPKRAPWYKYAIANDDDVITSTRELDLLTKVPVITFHRALHIERLNHTKEIFGAMAVAFLVQELDLWVEQLYYQWLHSSGLKFYLIDLSGNVVWTNGNRRHDSEKLIHITENEPQGSKVLIYNGKLQRLSCFVIETGLVQREYKVDLRSSEYTTSYKIEKNNKCFGLSLLSVAGTDLFILLMSTFPIDCTEDDVTLSKTPCNCSPNKCTTDWDIITECECPCLDGNPFTSICKNEYNFSSNNAQRCSPEPKAFRKFSLDSTNTSDLPACYILFDYEVQSGAMQVVIVVSSILASVLVLGVASAIGYHYHKTAKSKRKIRQSLIEKRKSTVRSRRSSGSSKSSRRSPSVKSPKESENLKDVRTYTDQNDCISSQTSNH